MILAMIILVGTLYIIDRWHPQRKLHNTLHAVFHGKDKHHGQILVQMNRVLFCAGSAHTYPYTGTYV